MSDITDEELMKRFQEGNVHAFDLLFERYRSPVYTFLRRMAGGDQGAAEDLLQEVFVKVCRGRDFYEPRSKFSSWLFTIARNHAVNHVRSRRYLQSRRTLSLDEDGGSAGPAVDRVPVPAGLPHADDVRERLEAAIQSLPEAYREVFLLRAVHGFHHDETARMLALNPATVRTHFRRARERLQQALQGPSPRDRAPEPGSCDEGSPR